jgi:Fe-S cluster biogenesis protein NfuA
MFIQTEQTPNPATLKFLPGEMVMGADGGTLHLTSAEEATISPLAKRLFSIKGVEGVFYGRDFVTVTKADAADWNVLKPQIFGALADQFTSDRPLLNESAENRREDRHADGDDDPISQQIKELLDTRIRPAVAMDGGDILFQEFSDGVVKLRLRGACAGCPSSTATLKAGVENMLKHYISEVQSVEAVG